MISDLTYLKTAPSSLWPPWAAACAWAWPPCGVGLGVHRVRAPSSGPRSGGGSVRSFCAIGNAKMCHIFTQPRTSLSQTLIRKHTFACAMYVRPSGRRKSVLKAQSSMLKNQKAQLETDITLTDRLPGRFWAYNTCCRRGSCPWSLVPPVLSTTSGPRSGCPFREAIVRLYGDRLQSCLQSCLQYSSSASTSRVLGSVTVARHCLPMHADSCSNTCTMQMASEPIEPVESCGSPLLVDKQRAAAVHGLGSPCQEGEPLLVGRPRAPLARAR